MVSCLCLEGLVEKVCFKLRVKELIQGHNEKKSPCNGKYIKVICSFVK